MKRKFFNPPVSCYFVLVYQWNYQYLILCCRQLTLYYMVFICASYTTNLLTCWCINDKASNVDNLVYHCAQLDYRSRLYADHVLYSNVKRHVKRYIWYWPTMPVFIKTYNVVSRDINPWNYCKFLVQPVLVDLHGETHVFDICLRLRQDGCMVSYHTTADFLPTHLQNNSKPT